MSTTTIPATREDVIIVASHLRELAWTRLRNLENPTLFAWTKEEETEFKELLVAVQSTFPHDFKSQTGTEQYWEEVIGYTSEVVEQWVAGGNTISQDVLQAFEQRETEPTPATSELSRRLGAHFGLSESGARRVAQLIVSRIPTNPEFAVTEALTVLDDLGASGSKQPNTVASAILLTALSPETEKASDTFAALLEYIATSSNNSKSSPVTQTAALLALAHSSDRIPSELTAEQESAMATVAQNPNQARELVAQLEKSSADLNQLIEKGGEISNYSHSIQETVLKDLATAPSKSSSDAEQIADLLKFSAPVVLGAWSVATKEIASPEKLNDFQRFLKIMAVEYGQANGFALSSSARHLLETTPLDRFFALITRVEPNDLSTEEKILSQDHPSSSDGSTTSDENSEKRNEETDDDIQEAKHAKRKVDMQKVDAFLADLADLKGDLTFEKAAVFAGKHFDLNKLDSSLDKYFNHYEGQVGGNPSLNMARMQNFAGDVIGRFVPGAKPIVALLKPINKLFFLAFDKLFGPALAWVGKAIRNALWQSFSGGIVAGLIFGAPIGIITAGTIYLVRSSFSAPTSAASALSNIPVQANSAMASSLSGLLAVVVSFLTVALITMMTIPILVALMLFIINNSAYMVPSSSSPLSSSGRGGSFPPGPGGAYPQCWPVNGLIFQGPACTSGHPEWGHCKHKSNALDISGNAGEEIYATHDGVVSTNCFDPNYGICARVISPLGFTTLYGHMVSAPLVTAGQAITAGTVLGFVGSTGDSTGPHLHYELFSVGVDVRNVVPNYELLAQTSGCLANTGGSDVPVSQ